MEFIDILDISRYLSSLSSFRSYRRWVAPEISTCFLQEFKPEFTEVRVIGLVDSRPSTLEEEEGYSWN